MHWNFHNLTRHTICRTVLQRCQLCIANGGSHCEQFSESNQLQTYFSVHYTNQLTDIWSTVWKCNGSKHRC
jgi:hypothetical protein